MSPVTCRYDLKVMKEQIAAADPDMRWFANAEGYAAGVNEEADADAYLDVYKRQILKLSTAGSGITSLSGSKKIIRRSL